MSEKQFTDLMKGELEKNLPSGYSVTSGESLIYKLFVDAQGQVQPQNVQEAKRGQLAFQTDLMIKKLRSVVSEGIPLVVVEVKFGRFTTHDILTYSAKATKHKEIYPYLRYGLVVGGVKKIDRRFFTHNSGFDFAVAVEKPEGLSEVTEIIKQQLEAAELMLKVFQGKEVKRYVTKIELTLNF
ncbi:MAG: hypothetical protein ABSA75_07115 [Candidatus Bathyarchaeia archaeon]|jgi:hypothetical protein